MLLALDLGRRRTGAALGDRQSDFVFALSTIRAQNDDDLLEAVFQCVHQRKITEIVAGLPRLLDGSEGEQAQWIRGISTAIKARTGIPVQLIDERYTSYGAAHGSDPDAKAACSLAEIALKIGDHYSMKRNHKKR